MYKHFRYRSLAANLAAYPFYANISEDFERRLDEGTRKLPPMTSKVKLPKGPSRTGVSCDGSSERVSKN
jgi:hypothetical protein